MLMCEVQWGFADLVREATAAMASKTCFDQAKEDQSS